MADTDLLAGDRIKLQHGPFVATWEVVDIIEAGARLAYCGDVRFVGHERPQVAPNGVVLTEDREHAFLGRAHWPATPRWRWNPMKQAFE